MNLVQVARGLASSVVLSRRLLVCLLLSTSAFALDITKLKPTGYVNDFAHAIDAASQQRLETYCGILERTAGAQMAIVTLDTLDGDDVADVANKLYHQWGIGKKPQDEGVLLLFAVKDKKDRAEIGYGLEATITDADAGAIMRNLRPILRQGSYGPAALAAAQQFGSMIANAKGVSLPGVDPRVRTRTTVSRGPSIPWPLIVIGIFFVLALLGRMGGGGGGFTGFLTGMFLGNMMGRGGGGWGGGGFGGSSGGGGGGFGGFGGGDSGGGGSSSDW
jgi:uncharacterized protein